LALDVSLNLDELLNGAALWEKSQHKLRRLLRLADAEAVKVIHKELFVKVFSFPAKLSL